MAAFDHTLIVTIVVILITDLFFGDPVYRFHPIRVMGHTIIYLEKKLIQWQLNHAIGGALLLVTLATLCIAGYLVIEWLLLQIPMPGFPILAFIWKIYIGWSLFAFRDLIHHGQRVKQALDTNQLDNARHAVSYLVGRETTRMDEKACARATVESLSENLVDGVISPLFYLALFGLPGMIFFKVVSTLDSMVGYKNERYHRFGFASAKLDDLLNYLPSRLTWLLLTVAALLIPKCSAKKAFIYGLKHYSLFPSPNSGWSEATIAGALQCRLVGPMWQEGKPIETPWIGDPNDRIGCSTDDINVTEKLLTLSLVLCLILVIGIPGIIDIIGWNLK